MEFDGLTEKDVVKFSIFESKEQPLWLRKMTKPDYYVNNKDEGFLFNFIPADESGLPVAISIDTYRGYKQYKHPLWVYFFNGYDANDATPVPIIVASQPYMPYPPKKMNISAADYNIVTSFIKKYRDELFDIANLEKDVYDIIDEYAATINEGFVNINPDALFEMGVLQRNVTGLPMKIWLDHTGAHQAASHNSYRIKFEYPKGENNTESWPSLIFPDSTHKDFRIVGVTDKQIGINEKNRLINFIKINKELFDLAAQKKISEREFSKKAIKVDKHGRPIDDREFTYEAFTENPADISYPYVRVYNKNTGLFNIANREDFTPMFDIWFHKVKEFKKDRNNKIYSVGTVLTDTGKKIYQLFDDSTIKEIKY